VVATTSTTGTPTAAAATVPDALRSGQWVLDRHGASKLISGVASQQVGLDPLFDSLTTLEYVRAAVGTAADVQRFNPESESYRPKLDPFPRPSAGILRFDLVPPVLTPRQTNTGLQRDLPDTAFFRLMAVYMRDGIIVEVRERIDIETRLNDPQSNLETRIHDYLNDPPSAINQQAVRLLQALNQQLVRTGKPAIRPREMDLRFTALGHAARVQLPQGASEASLAAVGDHGQVLFERH
jgi:hypothetical protein